MAREISRYKMLQILYLLFVGLFVRSFVIRINSMLTLLLYMVCGLQLDDVLSFPPSIFSYNLIVYTIRIAFVLRSH